MKLPNRNGFAIDDGWSRYMRGLDMLGPAKEDSKKEEDESLDDILRKVSILDFIEEKTEARSYIEQSERSKMVFINNNAAVFVVKLIPVIVAALWVLALLGLLSDLSSTDYYSSFSSSFTFIALTLIFLSAKRVSSKLSFNRAR